MTTLDNRVTYPYANDLLHLVSPHRKYQSTIGARSKTVHVGYSIFSGEPSDERGQICANFWLD